MRRLLAFSSVVEALTGAGLLAMPRTVVGALLGSPIEGAGLAVSRVAGVALIALAAACWPMRDLRAAAAGMLIYNVLVAVYLVVLGARGETVGVLLWPAAALHGVVSLLLVLGVKTMRAEFEGRSAHER